MSEESNAGTAQKRKRIPSVLVDCFDCGTPFEVDQRTFDLAVKLGRGRFVCDDCREVKP